MATQALTRLGERTPSLFDEFFKPWNEWFDGGSVFGRTLSIPAANITEEKDDYQVSLAVPGMKKDDFKIDIEGNLLTISCEKEEKNAEKEAKYRRREYNYFSFSRCFTIPDEVNREKIDAHYENGILKMVLPKKEEAKKNVALKHISVK